MLPVSPKPKNNLEIIQQWQYLGKVPPELLEDEAFENCKKAGITSLESYVLWSEIEKKPGEFDFSSYDPLVEKIKKHNLKWVPFLILGPAYATPKWFQQSEESVYAKCLEHKKESKIQSIWNPNLPKYVERFLKKASEHYQNKEILESVILGISGNWGEALFPSKGGFYGGFHTHWGWWCGDNYALKDFTDYVLKKYNSLESLNRAWTTNFQNIEDVTFPLLRQDKKQLFIDFLTGFLSKMPEFFKNWLKTIAKLILRKNFFLTQAGDSKPINANSWRWLNFVGWYLDSMTNWAEFWLKTARLYFPETKIYLVTGGTGNPILGADFSKQSKIAAKYEAGIRITNQTDDYSQSFILTRLVSTATKLYNTYFITEEAGITQTPEGVVMRIFDTITSGADGLYCKNIISTGNDPCIKRKLPAGEPTKGAENLVRNFQYFTNEKPIIKIAIFFPATSIVFDDSIITSIYNQCSVLRDVLDFDLIDENMIKDGGLERYQFLLILAGKIPQGQVSSKVEDWIEKGGKLVSRLKKEDLELIKKTVGNIDNEYDGVYATRFANKIIYYNSTNSKKRKKVELEDLSSKIIEIEGNSIVSISL